MAVRVRVELLDVTCRNTEDILVPDTFYVMGALAASDSVKSAVITDPIKITAEEAIAFPSQDVVLFDGLVADREAVLGGLKAFDEDFAKDWAKKSQWTRAIIQGLPAFADLPESLSASAELILTAAGNILDLQAHSDRDHLLGNLTLVVPMAGRWSEEERWTFTQKGPRPSTWDYTVRYLITRTQMV